MKPVSTGRINVVMQRHRSNVRVDNMARLRAEDATREKILSLSYLTVQEGDPFGELFGIRDRSREKDVVNIVGQQDDGLLPDDTTFLKRHEEVKR